jgi:protocatechuate 3,4-dioxygenase, beta subunit
MQQKNLITRRAIVQGTLGALAATASGRLMAGVTPAQTEGPFYPTRDQADKDIDLTLIEGHTERAQGEIIEVSGQVLDEGGKPVAEVLVDIWQANTNGRYAHEADPNPAPLDPNFQGWAQFRTDAEGRYRFKTIVPGAYQVDGSWSRPPHIHFKVARRGYHELITQMYFAGHALNDTDRILLGVPEDERGRLVVAFQADPADSSAPRNGRFDIVLRSA